MKNNKNIRKKIFTSKDIMKGEIFTRKNLTTLRAKKGVPSKNWEKLIGKKSNQNYKKGQAV
jgi:pseudaminic acid synthase